MGCGSCIDDWSGVAFTWQIFLSGVLLDAIQGIILQLVCVPAIMVALDDVSIMFFREQ